MFNKCSSIKSFEIDSRCLVECFRRLSDLYPSFSFLCYASTRTLFPAPQSSYSSKSQSTWYLICLLHPHYTYDSISQRIDRFTYIDILSNSIILIIFCSFRPHLFPSLLFTDERVYRQRNPCEFFVLMWQSTCRICLICLKHCVIFVYSRRTNANVSTLKDCKKNWEERRKLRKNIERRRSNFSKVSNHLFITCYSQNIACKT